MEHVVLVDEKDRPQGTMEKLQAHVEGRLHRALSVFIFNTQGHMLLQQRAAGKYHSGMLWTNTCCSHPRPGEDVPAAAIRRLHEEMGMTCELTPSFTFIYKALLDHDLTEYEFDHVFIGVTDAVPVPDPGEVAAYRYVSRDELEKEMAAYPAAFTEWFRICLRDWRSKLYVAK